MTRSPADGDDPECHKAIALPSSSGMTMNLFTLMATSTVKYNPKVRYPSTKLPVKYGAVDSVKSWSGPGTGSNMLISPMMSVTISSDDLMFLVLLARSSPRVCTSVAVVTSAIGVNVVISAVWELQASPDDVEESAVNTVLLAPTVCAITLPGADAVNMTPLAEMVLVGIASDWELQASPDAVEESAVRTVLLAPILCAINVSGEDAVSMSPLLERNLLVIVPNTLNPTMNQSTIITRYTITMATMIYLSEAVTEVDTMMIYVLNKKRMLDTFIYVRYISLHDESYEIGALVICVVYIVYQLLCCAPKD